MGAKLQALIELQDIELQIVDIRNQLARKERRAAAQAAAVDNAAKALDAERAELKRAQVQFDEVDLDIKGRTANINKIREYLNSVKTNKEYAAVLAQMNNEKADLSRVESRALEMMAKVEEIRKTIAKHEQTQREETARLEQLRAELEQAQRSFSARLGALETRRNDAAARVDKDALHLFNRTSERYDGEVMAKVVRTHPRRDEFICEGCNMSLQAQTANSLKTRDEVITCRNCGRILFIEQGS